MANMMQMMKKAQTFKVKMEELQERVKQTEITGSAGGGAVTCVVCNSRVKPGSMQLGAAAKDADPEMLLDLATAAVNDGLQKAEDMMRVETEKLMRDLGLPPGLGLPF